MSKGIPPAEVRIDVDLVRALLRAQHPDLADEELEVAGHGWDCVMVRIGAERAARLPRRAFAAPLAEVEQRWLPQLAPRLPIPVPVPLRVGEPGEGYPWPWTIVPWFPGVSLDCTSLDERAAVPLANFLVALHHPAPDDAPLNSWRGVPLAGRADAFHGWMADLRARPDGLSPTLAAAVDQVWNEAVAEPIDVAPTWLHGDLHPRNVIARDGMIAAIIDWGDVCTGDRATDLASLWTLLPTATARDDARRVLELEAGISPSTWARAKGWAAFFGAILFVAGLDDGDVPFADAGRATLERVAGDVDGCGRDVR